MIVKSEEVDEKKKEIKDATSIIKDHLRGFTRTIPSFLMAYGDNNTTLQNFDKYVDETSDILYFNIKSCDSNDVTKILSENRERLFELYKNTGDDRYFRICYTEPWGKFIKHQLIKDNHIQFQETKANNDLLFAMKSGLSAKTVLPVNVPLYWYVYREGLLGHSAKLEPIEKIRDRVRAWNSSQELLNGYGIKTAFYLPTIP
jgi:hypothetical protein